MPSIQIRERYVSWRRLLAGGIIVTALAGLAGGALELWWFGATDAAAVRRAEALVVRRFDAMVSVITGASARIAANPLAARALGEGQDGARALFVLLADVRATSASPDNLSITIYDPSAVARAWSGAPSDIISERIAAGPSVFFTPSPLGLRLVHVQPIETGDAHRVGTVASEHALGPPPPMTTLGPAEYQLETALAVAALRIEAPGDRPRPGAVILRAPSGEALAEAWVDPAALSAARTTWRRRVAGVMLGALAATVLLLVGPLLDRRAFGARGGAERTAASGVTGSSPPAASYLRTTTRALGLTLLGGALLWTAFAVAAGGLPRASVTLLVAGATAAALVSLLAGPASRLRIAVRGRPRPGAGPGALAASQLLAGTAVAGMILLFQQLLAAVANTAPIDLRHFSIHPLSAGRLTLLTAIVSLHLAVLWGCTMVLVAAIVRWRVPRSALRTRAAILALWLAPSAIGAAVASAREWPVPALGLVFSAAACSIAALNGARLASWYRRSTVAARIFALFLAFLLPALLLHPSMDFLAERATRELIATRYAVQALNHVQTLRDRMDEARREVDALAELPELVKAEGAPAAERLVSRFALNLPEYSGSTSQPDAAFVVWKQTVLARERLTSAVELYTAVPSRRVSACTWDVFGEVTPFGAEERRMLHAERGICVTEPDGSVLQYGTIILHVVLEYEALPFITSMNPYFEVFRSSEEAPQEGTPGGNVEVAIYGWGLQPLYISGQSAWPLTDELFQRIYRSREPFWAEASAGGVRHQVYFSNDRERIFAIGYPVLTLFDHFVHLAELTTFAGAAFVVVLLGTAVFTRVARQRPRVGRALLREIRASFYRKLFLAFVLAAIIPVLTLALVMRAYFENLLRTDIEAEAARTASIAERVIEEVDAPLRRSADVPGTFSDDVMVWTEQVIDQDVNVFIGPRLAATSERDLFASGVLPTRTPADVYRAIVLQRLPSFVRQDSIGGFTYMLAAAPVRAAGEEALLTVPLALRQREIEREIDELDRGVHLAALFFVLLGAAIGLSMAERIADPVRRLTRATGRIARGDFDARIAVKSTDELRRLVDAFNSMAEKLKAQRSQLERTHRLEAWAEMARQVAHEIKNPLTPIQLSAEHLERVHADQGRPLGPVLESCVTSILGQVRLLRQISAEFSSFASSPTARPALVDLPQLVEEVVDPYRTGLGGRVAIVNQVPPSLPPVFVDRTLVARALSNIVENALYAMPGTGTLTLEGAVDGENVRLSVTDTGAGMDKEALARVFEPYFSTKTTGTGLGLPIARRNIELNGGSIEVNSEKGVGTTVTVRLPVMRPSGEA